MESTPLPPLPKDILLQIFSLTPEKEIKDLASVSKDWNTVIKHHLASLFQNYTKSDLLTPYTELAKKKFTAKNKQEELTIEIKRAQFVFQQIMKKAQELGYSKDIKKTTSQNISVEHLQVVAKWIQEKEALNLITFASAIPEMKHIVPKKLSILDQAQYIRDWLKNSPKAKKIKELHLGNAQYLEKPNIFLPILPKEIQYLTGLESIQLNRCELKTLPTEIGLLTQLQEIDFSNNKITTLPTEIGLLTQLKIMNFSNNGITGLFTEIGLLSQLQTIKFFSNKIREIPTEIEMLTSLKSLDVAHNNISTLPTEIGMLTSLESLNIGYNNISTLPTEIGMQTSLKSLHITSTNLSNSSFSAFSEEAIRFLSNIIVL